MKGIVVLVVLVVLAVFATQAKEVLPKDYGKTDAIALLSSCGESCWDKVTNHQDDIKPESRGQNKKISKCMQACFKDKTGKDDEEEISEESAKKIMISAFCGHICWPAYQKTKKSLDFCYSGCLGLILRKVPGNK